MSELRAFAETLRDLGPWAALAILLYVLRELFLLVQKLQAARLEDQKAHAAFALGLLERTTAVLRDVVEAIRRK